VIGVLENHVSRLLRLRLEPARYRPRSAGDRGRRSGEAERKDRVDYFLILYEYDFYAIGRAGASGSLLREIPCSRELIPCSGKKSPCSSA
jgi:hypothetical protein